MSLKLVMQFPKKKKKNSGIEMKYIISDINPPVLQIS